jgi:RND family efflux transporter MFP subunit
MALSNMQHRPNESAPNESDFAPTELLDPAELLEPKKRGASKLKKLSQPMSDPSAPNGLSSLKIDRDAAPAKRRGNWLPWSLGALAVVGAAAWFFVVPHPVEIKTTSVVVSTPSQQYVQLTASGYVVAQTRAAVASKAAGRLIELNVREGSRVHKGDLIARLDSSDVRASILAAQAAVSQAEANVRQTEVEQINAEGELKRTKGLEAKGFVSAQAVDNAQTRVNAAHATVAAARAGLGQAKAQLKIQQVNEDFTEIRAPFDGVVLVKNANVGDMITPMSSAAGAQGAVVTMADMTTLEVEADVSEGNLSKASPDQPVEIVLDALPDTRFRGHVVGIVPTVDRAKATVMTKIRFDQLDPRILPEMSAKAAFLSQPITEADQQPLLAVNPAAVAQRDGASVVFKLRGAANKDGVDQVDVVKVTVGRKLGDVVEINAGPGATAPALKSGDKLVLEPSSKVKAGASVRLSSS